MASTVAEQNPVSAAGGRRRSPAGPHLSLFSSLPNPVGGQVRKLYGIWLFRLFHRRERHKDLELQANGVIATPVAPLDESRRDLFNLITRNHGAVSKELQSTFAWYTSFLECRFRRFWASMLVRTVANLDFVPDENESLEPTQAELVIVYRLVSVVAELLRSSKDFSLRVIADQLQAKGFLRSQSDETLVLLEQLVFTSLGWLTMLYNPNPSPELGKLEIAPSLETYKRANGTRSRVFRTMSLGLEAGDQPFHLLLRHFGSLVPLPPSYNLLDTIPNRLASIQREEYIMMNNVCFYTVHEVIHIKIAWCESLNQHLELDEARRTLKLFRFPSFCRMMCSKGHDHFLNQLFHDYSSGLDEDEFKDTNAHLSDDFFTEVLISYRLLFGQDSQSWRAFSRGIKGANRDWDHNELKTDPILVTLCGEKWSNAEPLKIYREIGGSDDGHDVSNCYHSSDFPYLGERLLLLQRYVTAQHPHDWSALWRDRRNASKWWTFWAVLFIGALTITLSLVQSIFQIIEAAREGRHAD